MNRNTTIPYTRSNLLSIIDNCPEQSSDEEDEKLPNLNINKFARKPPKVSQSSNSLIQLLLTMPKKAPTSTKSSSSLSQYQQFRPKDIILEEQYC